MYKKTKPFFSILIAVFLIITVIFAAMTIIRFIFPDDYAAQINKYSRLYGTDPYLALAIIRAESGFNPDSVSNVNAKGLMQLTDETFEFCKSKIRLEKDSDIFNPEANIQAGIWYLSYLSGVFGNENINILASYNAGASNVKKWLKLAAYSQDGRTLKSVPYQETLVYINKINRYRKIYAFLYPQYK